MCVVIFSEITAIISKVIKSNPSTAHPPTPHFGSQSTRNSLVCLCLKKNCCYCMFRDVTEPPKSVLDILIFNDSFIFLLHSDLWRSAGAHLLAGPHRKTICLSIRPTCMFLDCDKSSQESANTAMTDNNRKESLCLTTFSLKPCRTVRSFTTTMSEKCVFLLLSSDIKGFYVFWSCLGCLKFQFNYSLLIHFC